MSRTAARRAALALVALSGCALSLAACTRTLDPKSGEDLITKYIQRSPLLTLRSVSCPSGIKPKDGTSFDCKVTVRRNSNGSLHTGTITVHITNGAKRVQIYGPQDVHIR